jgi:hypothetical protein
MILYTTVADAQDIALALGVHLLPKPFSVEQFDGLAKKIEAAENTSPPKVSGAISSVTH